MARISHFECSRCAERVEMSAYERNLRQEHRLAACPKCAGALLVRYDPQTMAARTSVAATQMRMSGTMWRYAAALPEVAPLTLGEGFTPLLPSRRTPHLLIKDEGLNPRGTSKARAMSMVVAMAVGYGLEKLALVSTGASAPALAAYAAAAGLQSFLFFPKQVPATIAAECQTYGAQVVRVEGSVSDCAHVLAEWQPAEGFYDISHSFPFRVEGQKTIGCEIAEQMGWTLPEAILCSGDNGTEIISLWKAFTEMRPFGWLPEGLRLPKMVSVKSSSCDSIIKALDDGRSEAWKRPNRDTDDPGMRESASFVRDSVLQILKASGGTTAAVTDREIMEAQQTLARQEGISAGMEGAATLAAYRRLIASGFLNAEETVVLINSSSALKPAQPVTGAGGRELAKPKPRAIGGIIQPY